jgi:hypothetical protein
LHLGCGAIFTDEIPRCARDDRGRNARARFTNIYFRRASADAASLPVDLLMLTCQPRGCSVSQPSKSHADLGPNPAETGLVWSPWESPVPLASLGPYAWHQCCHRRFQISITVRARIRRHVCDKSGRFLSSRWGFPLGRPHQQNGNGRGANDNLGIAAEHQAIHAAPAVRAHHNQIGLPLFCFADNVV